MSCNKALQGKETGSYGRQGVVAGSEARSSREAGSGGSQSVRKHAEVAEVGRKPSVIASLLSLNDRRKAELERRLKRLR